MGVEHLEIIVGTYEEFLLGYKVVQHENEEYTLVQSFANHSHRASVRSVAAGGKFLASGGADESILLYDMVARKEAGLLMQHHGNISCLEFSPNGTHLLSGSEDGTIGACRTGNWQLEKFWGSAHKGSAVTSISIHPSGKLFLSVGTDATLKTWNLIKGRVAYATNLCKIKDGRTVTQVLWSSNGETYAVVIGNRVEIFTVAAASITHTIEVGNKVTCICFVDADVLWVATEEGDVQIHDVDKKMEIGQFKAHDGRIRCMMSYETDWVVTASSSGLIKLWWRKDRCRVKELCKTNIGCRVTCLTVITSMPTPQESKELLMCAALDLEEAMLLAPPARKRPVGIVTVEESGQTSTQTCQTLPNTQTSKKKRRRQKKAAKPVQMRESDSSSSDGELQKVENGGYKKTFKNTTFEDGSDSSNSEDEAETNVRQPIRKKKNKSNSNAALKEIEEVDSDSLASDSEPEEIDTKLTNKSRQVATNTIKSSAVERRKGKKRPIVHVEPSGTKAAKKERKQASGSKKKSTSGAWTMG